MPRSANSSRNAMRDGQIIGKAQTGLYSLKELADEYNLSKERVRVILASADVNIVEARQDMAKRVLDDPQNAAKSASQLSREYGYSKSFWRNAINAHSEPNAPFRIVRDTSRLVVLVMRHSRACEAEFVFDEQGAAVRFCETVSRYVRGHQDECPDIQVERRRSRVTVKRDAGNPAVVARGV